VRSGWVGGDVREPARTEVLVVLHAALESEAGCGFGCGYESSKCVAILLTVRMAQLELRGNIL
jgi:hypothetical protein